MPEDRASRDGRHGRNLRSLCRSPLIRRMLEQRPAPPFPNGNVSPSRHRRLLRQGLSWEPYTRSNLSHLQRVVDRALVLPEGFRVLLALIAIDRFSRVDQSAYRQSNMPDVEILDTHCESLHVEGVK